MGAGEIFRGSVLAVGNIVLFGDVSRLERRGLFSRGQIATRRDLVDLRAFVRQDMLVSLLLLATVTASAIGSAVGFALQVDVLKWMALGLGVLLPASPFLFVAAATRQRIRGLAVAPELRSEVDDLLRAWTSRIIPIAAVRSVGRGVIVVSGRRHPRWLEALSSRRGPLKIALSVGVLAGSTMYARSGAREPPPIEEQVAIRRAYVEASPEWQRFGFAGHAAGSTVCPFADELVDRGLPIRRDRPRRGP